MVLRYICSFWDDLNGYGKGMFSHCRVDGSHVKDFRLFEQIEICYITHLHLSGIHVESGFVSFPSARFLLMAIKVRYENLTIHLTAGTLVN